MAKAFTLLILLESFDIRREGKRGRCLVASIALFNRPLDTMEARTKVIRDNASDEDVSTAGVPVVDKGQQAYRVKVIIAMLC